MDDRRDNILSYVIGMGIGLAVGVTIGRSADDDREIDLAPVVAWVQNSALPTIAAALAAVTVMMLMAKLAFRYAPYLREAIERRQKND